MYKLKKSTFVFSIPALLLMFFLQACGDGSTGYYQREFTPPEPYDVSQSVSDTTTADGLEIHVIEEGYGRIEVIHRDRVQVKYTGRIVEEDGSLGDVFDSSYINNQTETTTFNNLTPNPIPSGNGGQISPLVDGFRRGIIKEVSEDTTNILSGMKEGEKRVLIIPPALAYGEADENSSSSLAGRTLRFDVELVQIAE
ncbi:FKBP-type peptidyl-prolyl cis-trans isomerase [Fodinibius salsisoli]|uniref:Peptidyl-prolyl cis-trans isomerase n=1 Tax=Fodinibius salsisoli TaxID=2820877 RepID=A0ABT3PJ23_9BACT|nr:FKBP-type peptidyl-prolyl cis-trans isomerase [Fodinibius salsisoli]MCW9705934.1 FKBP-type peptidyl-prolyl cis-trans isomerase [Fodinibius salsisoli]